MDRPKIALLGATGRLGTALRRQWGPSRLLGLARHPPEDVELWAGFVAADRLNIKAVAELLAGADAVVDLCGFDGVDAEALIQAARLSGRTGLRLLAASSVAERPISHWNQPETAASPLPDDAYGLHKRQYSSILLQNWPGQTLAALLPNLVQTEPLDPRLREWWRQAAQSGIAQIPGSGQQIPALLPARVAADLLALLVDRPDVTGRIALACPQAPPVVELARAFFGAMTPAPALQPGAPAGLFSGGAEVLALDAMLAALPEYPWPDLPALFAALGERLATSPRES